MKIKSLQKMYIINYQKFPVDSTVKRSNGDIQKIVMKENKFALISQNTLIFRRLNIPFLQHGYNLHLSSLTRTVLWMLQCKDNTCILYVQIIRRDMQIIIVNEVCYTGFIHINFEGKGCKNAFNQKHWLYCYIT